MRSKKYISAFAAAVLAVTSLGKLNVSADITPNPVISRNCPAYTGGDGQASAANDEHYFSFWTGKTEDYIAYDLSKVPDSEKKQVIAVWYNTSTYEKIGDYASVNMMPTDYTIEINAAEGGSYPEDGWKVVETVTDNTFASRQHLVDMKGYNWIQMNITKADGEKGKQASINFDIHNVSEGVSDSWLFLGDSITAGGMNNCYGTGFAAYVNQLDSRYFPIQENGGIGGIRSIDGKNNIDHWLSVSQAKYVSIAYGTNDAWGNPNAADIFYNNTKYMIDAVISAGKIPVLPKIPASTNEDVKSNVPLCNKMVDKLYEEYGEKLVKGPDFQKFFEDNPEFLSSDGVHPSSEGYDEMRQIWAKTMYENVYKSDAPAGTDTTESSSAVTDITEKPSEKPDTSEEPTGAVLKGDVNLDKTVSVADIVLLQKYIACAETLKKEQADNADINSDKTVDVFDAVMLRRQLVLSEAEEGDVTVTKWEADESNVKLTGRNLIKDGVTWLLQSGSAAEFTVTGESAELVLSGKNGINADKDFRPRYAVYVDDELITDETMDSKEEKVELFSGSKSVSKNVKVIMLSEAMQGAIGIDCINVKSGVKTPVKPAAKKALSIEFIGDSITCGYGVEGADAYESFKTTTENFTKSYAYLTAKKLNADYSAVSYSGHGIVSGYSSDGSKNGDSVVPDIYELCSKAYGYDEKWDFTSEKHDAVVINLGTNDINYVDAEPETHSAEFVDEYVKFLKTVRKNNSEAQIICTVGTMGNGETGMYELIEKAIEDYCKETGDEKVTGYKSAVQNMTADGIGSDWHPSAVTQQNSAYVLSDKICQVLGIESDQVGLDVAADAEYDVRKSADAMESHFVGYDKSFWINMVTGGKNPEDVVAFLSGISLKKDGEYRLEFDCTATVKSDIKVSVKGKTEHFADTVTMDSEKTHYSETFKVSEDDGESELTFDIGGIDSFNVTLSNIKLTKIA